ncbi:MAG: sulfatase-like hydrolase/transferase, partial [Verrucomicrobiota bacterium]|nr:sulfatase-like hydrolase/transferase [Verrucomicrobiota bacterium]
MIQSNLCADQGAFIKPQESLPNIVLIITDDQGYGDLGFTGNSVIETPAIDQLRRQSVLLDNFHVDPT